MSTEALEQAFASTRTILSNVKNNQLDNDTPCQSWKVRDVVNHVVGNSLWAAEAVDTGEAGSPPEDNFADGDFLAEYDKGIKAAVDAFGAPGAQEKTIKLPFGPFPGIGFMGLVTTDAFTHGWDIAKATGQDTDLEPELAARLLEASRANIQDAFRGPDGKAPFGSAQEVPDAAPAADQLAGFLGRKV